MERLEELGDLLVTLGVGGLEVFGRAVEGEGFLDGEVEDVGDGFAAVVDVEGGRLVAAAVAVGTGDVEVGEELHLHLLAAGTGAAVAAAFAGVEGKEAGVGLAGLGVFGLGKELADGVEGSEQHGGGRARSAGERRLIDEQDVAQVLRAP